MSSEGLHEPIERLSEATLDIHRAIVSLMEEFEAVDWYQQRVDATGDAELKAVLAHNRDEEIEHAAMNLEWLRRNMPKLDEELRANLFTEGPIVGGHGQEGAEEASAEARPHNDGDLGIRSLRA